MTTGRDEITVKQGDVGNTHFGTLYRNDQIVNLTDAVEVRLHAEDHFGNDIIDEAMSFVDREAGSVSYVWQAADLTRSGDFLYEYQVDWGSGRYESFPEDRVGFPMTIIRQIK